MPPSELPEMYWRPSFGHWCSIRPRDIRDMTPGQLWQMNDAIKEANSG